MYPCRFCSTTISIFYNYLNPGSENICPSTDYMMRQKDGYRAILLEMDGTSEGVIENVLLI